MTEKIKKYSVSAVFILLAVCSMFWIVNSGLVIERGAAKDGIFDITKGYHENKVYTLSGEMHFEKGIQTIESGSKTNIRVPSNWDKVIVDGKKMSKYGAGTYFLHLKLKKPGTYGILPQYIASAYKILVNGEEVYSCGDFGTSYKTETAYWNQDMVLFHCDTTDVELCIQVTNYHSSYGGIRTNLYFGSQQAISHYQIFHIVKAVLLIGIFIGCGIYIIMINRSIDKVKAYIWLGVFCFASVVLISIIDGGALFSIFHNVPVEVPRRLQVISIISILISMRRTVEYFFPLDKKGWSWNVIKILNVLYLLGGMFIPVNSLLFGYCFNIAIILLNVYCYLKIWIHAVVKKLPYAKVVTFGTFFLLLCGLIQLLYFNNILNNDVLSNFNFFVIGVFGFLLCETYVLARSIRKNYEDSKLAKDMEIAFLQAQISPHFFFNVINNIYYLMETEPDKAKSLLISFSSYLRVKHKFDYRNTVFYTLKEELDLVKSFIEIENVRLDGQLDYQTEVEEELLEMKVLPLIIQPLTENAIKHGFRAELLTLKVSVKKEQDKVKFTVEDTGKGMGKDTLLRLQNQQIDSGGVGMKNINYRLDKCYHTKLNIKSAVGAGTKIEFSIPLEVENERSNS